MRKLQLLCACLCLFVSAFAQNSELKPKPKKHTATASVKRLEDSLLIPGLERYRKIWIYLPPTYAKSTKRYPVLYMHDGQNLFDEFYAYAGEWGVDETLDSLYKKEGFELIVVGIDNGAEKRMNEYSPWKNDRVGEPEGKEYMQFVVQSVKPLIDKNYRTLTDAKNTGIMGSSMGGLISHYALFQYPQVFSKAGIFSPSYWFSQEAYSFVTKDKISKEQKIYFTLGEREHLSMTNDLVRMYSHLLEAGFPEQQVSLAIVREGRHQEAFWRKEFPTAILWLFAQSQEKI
jgi:predicted alpha/beta superfamily hydrolase